MGIISIAINTSPPYQHNFHDCSFTASIIERKANSTFYTTYLLKSDNIYCSNNTLPAQKILYRDYSKTLAHITTERITASATLKPIHSAINPYQFDYEKHLISNNIRLTASDLNLHSTSPETHLLTKIKAALTKKISAHLSSKNAAIILAITTGDRGTLTSQQKEQLQNTGTTHLLAISGLHVMLIGGMAWLLTQWLWACSWRLSDLIAPRDAGACMALVIISIYAFLTGFNIPVRRAWLMSATMIVSWLLRRGLTNQSLLIAAMIVLFISPYAVVSISFYYSFLATFIVIWALSLPYSPLLRFVILQAALFITITPLTWWFFGTVSMSSFFTNLIIIPWLGIWILPIALLAISMSFIHASFATPLWHLLDLTTTMLWHSITFFNHLHMTIESTFRPSLWGVCIYTLMCLALILTKQKRYFFLLLLLLIPNISKNVPEIVIADRRYTSILIHNGKNAFIIDPGRRYQQINQAKMWQRYLQENNLTLEAIILSEDKISRISSTKWLIGKFPDTRIITLNDFELPYPSEYCTTIHYDNLSLINENKPQQCSAYINWFDQKITLFSHSQNAIMNGSNFVWNSKTYHSKSIGAIRLQLTSDGISLTGLRSKKRLWRNSNLTEHEIK